MPGTAAAISLARRLLDTSLRRRDEPRSVVARAVAAYPGVDNGPDEPAAAADLGRRRACSPIWPCSGRGLPSQTVTRLLVGSYPTVSPLPEPRRVGTAHQKR